MQKSANHRPGLQLINQSGAIVPNIDFVPANERRASASRCNAFCCLTVFVCVSLDFDNSTFQIIFIVSDIHIQTVNFKSFGGI